MLGSDARHFDAMARRLFVYTADGAIDEWHSSAEQVLKGEQFFDDCDGLASTVVDLCFRAGCPESDLYRLAVTASSDGSGHMVACIETSDEGLLIVGDTFRPAYPAAEIQHHPDIYRRLSESEWRKGFPFTLEEGKAA